MPFKIANPDDLLERQYCSFGDDDEAYYTILFSYVEAYETHRDDGIILLQYKKWWFKNDKADTVSGMLRIEFHNNEIAYFVKDDWKFVRKPKYFEKTMEENIYFVLEGLYQNIIQYSDIPNYKIGGFQLKAKEIIEGCLEGVWT